MPQPADHRAGSRRLAAVHAGSGEGDDRNAGGVEDRVVLERRFADARRHTDTLTQVGEVQDRTEHFAVERRTDVRVRRVAQAHHATDVEELDSVADGERLGQSARVAA